MLNPLRWLVPQAEESRPVPARACDCESNLREAGVRLSIPGKAIGKHRYLLHPAVPLTAEDGARSDVRDTSARVHGALPSFLGRTRAVEQTPTFAIEVTQLIGLQPVGEDAKQEMSNKLTVCAIPISACA
jgi:hypothetical protein